MARWFRFYDEALDDPKVQRLAPHLFKTWVNLLCLASKDGGKLPSNDDIAFKLRISIQDAAQQIEDLIMAGLVDIDAKGARTPHNWENRQYSSDSSAERTRKYRENKKKKTCDVTGDVTVTLQKQNRTDSETEKEKCSSAQERAPAAALPDRFMDRMIEAARGCLANECNAQGLLTEATPMMWLESGADFERDVLPTLRAAAVSRKGKRIATWSYFTAMISEARAKRLAGLPAFEVGKPRFKQSDYLPTPRSREISPEERERIALEMERMN